MNTPSKNRRRVAQLQNGATEGKGLNKSNNQRKRPKGNPHFGRKGK